MRIEVGCDLEEFKRYYKQLALDKQWQGTFGFTEELGTSWERVLTQKPSLLIVWREGHGIIGHAIWHESNTDEHRKGDPRDKEDKEALRKLLGGKKDFVELHEIWLRKEHRGKGYGEQFFGFFEEFIRKQGYEAIVYYADHPAAISICRKRGYREAYLEKEKWHVFSLTLGKEDKQENTSTSFV